MKNTTHLLFLYIFLLVSACGSNQQKDEDNCQTFELSQFSDMDLSEKGETITDDPDILGIPGRIFAVNDSIIAICHTTGNIQVSLLNIKSGQHQVAIKKGEGPLEMLNGSILSSDDQGNIWVSGYMDGKIMTTKWNPAGDESLTEYKYRAQINLHRGVTDGKGGMIGLPASQQNTRILMLNNTGQAVDSLGIFPTTTFPDSITPNNYMFQADIAYSPAAEKLAVANLDWNKIEIYDVSSRDYTILKYPLDKEIELKRKDYGIVYSYNPSPAWFTFAEVSAGDNGFTTGFKGIEIKSEEDYGRGIRKILEFDWDGKPQRSFSFGDDIVTYDFDFKNNVIYTIENRPEPTLIKYKLKQ